ncbi:phosphate signaling complex protein PhoU [uncultured Phascolarctobacterium sp.]|uniref:phosphate signaling complex protein PhoU n=1 Tax=uncultured Phascolarctobacterium sp. TaxID=512296 RepID=UPI002636DA80|nr:phosphate signaling complex protein PhoU [uncultured Phascolarctobacterium sp.]
MRNYFDEQLALLNREMIEMGALCEEVIALAASALISGDVYFAAKVTARDKEIDKKERNIETLCLKLLLEQQPVARDLRQISAALKMITDMERIGDQAENIAEITLSLGGRSLETQDVLKKMGVATMKMVTDSVDAYVKQDVALAQAVIEYDDVVDNCFIDVKKQLIEYISAESNDGEYALDLLMIAKYFERIGDHATNLAEWVIYSVTGVHKSEEEKA